jgi:hypothetical protein
MEAKHKDQMEFTVIHWTITKVSWFWLSVLCVICRAQMQRPHNLDNEL